MYEYFYRPFLQSKCFRYSFCFFSERTDERPFPWRWQPTGQEEGQGGLHDNRLPCARAPLPRWWWLFIWMIVTVVSLSYLVAFKRRTHQDHRPHGRDHVIRGHLLGLNRRHKTHFDLRKKMIDFAHKNATHRSRNWTLNATFAHNICAANCNIWPPKKSIWAQQNTPNKKKKKLQNNQTKCSTHHFLFLLPCWWQ